MRLLITITVLILCTNSNAQKEKYFASKWRDIASASSVPAITEYVSAQKGEVLYSLANDDENIFVDVLFTESLQQNKLLQMGMTLWINQDGKERKVTGIRFPIGAKYSKGGGMQREQNPLVKVSLLSQANTIELVGFKDVKPSRFPSNNEDNIRGFVKYDNDGNLICSLTIPISKLPSGAAKASESLPLTLGIEYGAPPKMDISSGMPSGPGGAARMGGGGGRSGGSRGGASGGGAAPAGGAPGGSAAPQNLPKPIIFWMKNMLHSGILVD